MFKQTLQARRKRNRLFNVILNIFGAIDLDTELYRELRTPWGFSDRRGYEV